MIMLFLGLLDMIASIALWLSLKHTAFLFLGFFLIIKGLWSYISAASARFFFDLLGICDIAAGILLVLQFFGITFPFAVYLAIIVFLKGLYSFALDFFLTFFRA